jgi:hypothetical protein
VGKSVPFSENMEKNQTLRVLVFRNFQITDFFSVVGNLIHKPLFDKTMVSILFQTAFLFEICEILYIQKCVIFNHGKIEHL